MSELYTYHFDEAVMSIPGGFEDQSAQVLQWPSPSGPKDPPMLLVISRREMLEPFAEVVRKDIDDTRVGLKACVVEADAEGRLADMDAHYLTMRYVRDQHALYHRQVFVSLRDKLLTVFAVGVAAVRDDVDELFTKAADGLRFRE